MQQRAGHPFLLQFVADVVLVDALPDLIAMLKRRSNAGMNPRMVAIMCVFQVRWVYYGLLIASRPVIVMIGVLTNSLSVGAYAYFFRQERVEQQKLSEV